MNFTPLKFVVSVTLLLCSISAQAIIIDTGSLHYDTDTQVISSDSGLSYLGWGVAADLNYEQTLAATQTGGLYEGYHIAREAEARAFFLQATGTSEPYTSVLAPDAAGRSRFGDNNFEDQLVGPASTAFYLIDYPSSSYQGVGLIMSSDISLEYYLDEIDIDTSDEYSSSGSAENSTISWLLVSNSSTTAAIPEPATIYLVALGIFAVVLIRRSKKAS